MKKKILIILAGLLLINLIPLADAASDGNWAYKIGGVYYYWTYPQMKYAQYNDYYYTLSILTGWDINIKDFLENVCPDELATMPPEMWNSIVNYPRGMFYGSSKGTMIMNGDSGWQFSRTRHVWISPDNEMFSGDLPPYQFLEWQTIDGVNPGETWLDYADRLPTAPTGAPFPAPHYSGTPHNTLPLYKYANNIRKWSEMTNPYPTAISEDPYDGSYWEWTSEMSQRLGKIGLDPAMSRTRLGYKTLSNGNVTVVGMGTDGHMKEWTLGQVQGKGWITGTGEAASDDLLWVLRAVEAIPGGKGTITLSTMNTNTAVYMTNLNRFVEVTGRSTSYNAFKTKTIPTDQFLVNTSVKEMLSAYPNNNVVNTVQYVQKEFSGFNSSGNSETALSGTKSQLKGISMQYSKISPAVPSAINFSSYKIPRVVG